MAEPDLAAISALMDRHGIAEFEYEEGGRHIRLLRDRTAAPKAFVPAALMLKKSAEHILYAPYAGRFEPLALLGDERPRFPRPIGRGEIVGFLSIGPLRRPVIADVDGVVIRALAEAGDVVGYGTPLFAMHVI